MDMEELRLERMIGLRAGSPVSLRQAWLADVLARMPNMPVSRLPELLPWNWRQHSAQKKAA